MFTLDLLGFRFGVGPQHPSGIIILPRGTWHISQPPIDRWGTMMLVVVGRGKAVCQSYQVILVDKGNC